MTSPRERAPLDATDLAILDHLQRDARISNAELGRRVGLVASAIFQRLRKLEAAGVIEAHETRIDPSAVGLGLAAFVFVRVDERVGSLQAAQQLAELSEVQEIHHVAGEDCYLLKVRVPDTTALGGFLRQRIGSIDSVESTRTTIVLETVKETAELPLPHAEPAR